MAEIELLHIYPQEAWHSPAVVVGNRVGLTLLRDAINDALEKGLGQALEFTTDGEGYEVNAVLLDEPWESTEWLRLDVPYTDTEMVGERRPDKVDGVTLFIERCESGAITDRAKHYALPWVRRVDHR